jgi:hypothetical protein
MPSTGCQNLRFASVLTPVMAGVGWDTIDRLPSLSLSVRREPNGCRNRDRSPEVRITRKRIDYDYDNENENEKIQKYGSQQSHAMDG